ncbi:MAG TPA: DUF4232 domain-containing protein [Solirubrobacteraceae bacterium]|jgi:hypothetical protein
MTVRHLSRPHPRVRRTVLALCAVTAAAVSALSVAAVPSAGAAPPACRTGGLVIWMDTQGNGTAGTIFYTLNLTNLSGHTCTLRGFPGVSAVNLRGSRLGRAAARDTGQTVRTITLAAGRTAHATLGIVDIGVLPTSSCPPTTAAGLRVFPPNQTTSKVIPFPFAACARGGATFLRIRPVTR